MRLQLKSTDERAVSPVIGVILMVAITVILAAVIGTFVMGIGQDASQSAPQASLTVELDTSNNNATITHEGGDGLTDGDTRVLVTNESSGTTVTIDTGTSDETWTVGNDLVLNLNETSGATQNAKVSTKDSDVFTGRSAASDWIKVKSGFQYTIKIIDTKSQRTIFETTVTA